jgi:pimeloyl-ACP methyl ester carboxylesterase
MTSVVALSEPPQTGSFTLKLTDKSTHSDQGKITRRAGWSLELIRKQSNPDYDLADESFEAYVPAAYNGEEAYGLFVFVSAGAKGGIPENYKALLDQRKLIWVGPNNAGNPRPMLIRMGLAFDAVDGVSKRYKIDPQRIYISGNSGGGKIASVLGAEYPDVFTGAFYIVGADFYRQVPTGEPNHVWPKAFNVAEAKMQGDLKRRNRYVYLTGEGDMNRPPMVAFAEAMKQDRFQHVTLLDVPGLGHRMPDAQWFDKGLAALDEIPAATTKAVTRPAIQPIPK